MCGSISLTSERARSSIASKTLAAAAALERVIGGAASELVELEVASDGAADGVVREARASCCMTLDLSICIMV